MMNSTLGSCEQSSVRVPCKVRDLKTATYKTINVWDQEYNKDVVSPQDFVFVTISMCVSYLTCQTR